MKGSNHARRSTKGERLSQMLSFEESESHLEQLFNERPGEQESIVPGCHIDD